MQLEKNNKPIAKSVELAALGLGIALNISFLHGVCILSWGYFDFSKEFSGYALYITSFIGAVAISRCVAKFLMRFF